MPRVHFIPPKIILIEVHFWQDKFLDVKKKLKSEKFKVKIFFGLRKCLTPKNVGLKKKDLGPNFVFGKHHLCVTNRFLVGSVNVDLGGVLLVVLVLLVTWVNRTPKPLNSAKSP